MIIPDLGADMLQMVLDASSDFYWVKDLQGRYILTNQALCDHILMCDSPKQAQGKTSLFFIQDQNQKEDDQTFEKICMTLDDQVIQIKTSKQFFEQGRIKGKSIALDIKISPVFDKSGQMIATFGYARDITREKEQQQAQHEFEQQKAENEKNLMVSQIAGKLAHDFNNILSVVMGLSQLALIESPSHEMTKYLNDIFLQSRKGSELTRNLITFVNDREPFFSFLKIDEIIDHILCPLDKQLATIKTIIEIQSDLPRLFADMEMVQITLTNLICNAVHALGRCPNPCLEIRVFSQDQSICFQIKDNGCGIPDHALEKIVDPSYSLKGGRDKTCSYQSHIRGSGYGLSIVKKLMEKHHGSLSFDSKFGSGARFTISFPMVLETLIHQGMNESENYEIVRKKRILLVEDELLISQMQSKILSEKPFEHIVEIADNGEIAMNLLAQNTYDLVSLDYMLPGSLNGIDVYQYIRKENCNCPVLFVSGNIEFIESVQTLKNNDRHVAHLSKPCGNYEYAKTINHLLLTAER
ncbi:MAG: ATP-binding protein [Pseudomonadota bacterium]